MKADAVSGGMRRPFYDGATLHVRSYDTLDRGDRPILRGELEFYAALARRANGEVLEIGVGTGRVALELARAGIRVTGLDLSAAMLAIAAAKAAASGLGDQLRLERTPPPSPPRARPRNRRAMC